MLASKKFFLLTLVLAAAILTFYFSSCNDNPIDTEAQTDDEYLQNAAINSSFSTDSDDEDNLFANEVSDYNEGPVYNSPYDSLLKWGRRVTNVTVNASITSIGDTIKNVAVTRTITGNFVIIGFSGGTQDSTVKPYTEEQKRLIVFKRIARSPRPRFNWRVFKFSAVDGETKTPEIGKNNIVVNKVEFYVNNNLALTLNGPDFTSNIFTSRFFGGNNLLEIRRGDMVRTKVYLTSNQSDTDLVAFHWARNTFGFHREKFLMTSQIPNGGNFDRTYEKTFQVFSMHDMGVRNSFISANTKSSLFDSSPALFSSTYLGLPYRVRP